VIYRHAALFSYVWRHGVQCRGVGSRPGGPCTGLVVAACPVLEQGRLRGWRRSGWQGRLQVGSRKPLTAIRTGYSGRHGGVPSPHAQQRWSCCSSTRRGAARAGMAAQDWQWRGWRSRRPDVMVWPCGTTREGFEGATGPPSWARCVSRTGVGGTVSRSWHWPCCIVPHSGGDGFPLGSWRNSAGAWFPNAWWRSSAVSEH
jgi:hypothetical protein